MSNFIDRRLNSKNKSTVNRQRFIRRYKTQIKKSVSDAINQRSVTDVNSGETITIPKKDLSEPIFHQDSGGIRDRVHPGNDQFNAGDRIARPGNNQNQQGAGQGDASDSGEGNDDFVFSIDKEEYLNLLFEGLALPNLEKNQLDKLVEYKTVRSGYCAEGVPTNIDIIKSLQGSIARRIAMTSSKRRQLKELEQSLFELEKSNATEDAIYQLKQQIQSLKDKIAKVPFIDTFDLHYRNYAKQAVPTSKAVMFCLMDVSGSMDQATKEIAKRFYILLYLFLTRTYKSIDVVYIRHHTQAKEVDEQEFFYSQETGGTIASSALILMNEIIKERYSEGHWNIYGAQASDGDNWADDSPQCGKLLTNHILPKSRYFSYIEITQHAHQTLWQQYKEVEQTSSRFAMKHIKSIDDIFPVFRDLFKKSTKQAA